MSEHGAKRVEIAQTLDRGLQVLEQLGNHPGGLTVAEVAVQLGVHRSIAARLLTTLDLRGFAVRRRDGRYALGLTLLSLSRNVSDSISSVATPLLEQLADELQVTGVLHVADGEEAITVASVESSRAPFRIGLRIGARTPLTVAAHGLAILAGREAADGERVEVTLARKTGYAVTTGEVVPGYTGISAPVIVDRRCSTSLGVVLPQGRTDDEAAIGARVVEAARRLSVALG